MEASCQILVLEDSDSDFALLQHYFEKHAQFEVSLNRVESRDEFVSALKGTCDVVLSDYNVPGFGAIPVLHYLKENQIDIPLIVMSGELGEERAIEIMHAGAEDFVRKGNLARLIPAVERSIRASTLRKKKVRLRVAHERALQDRERLMDVVCHDIKNPLSSVRLTCQLLLQKAKESKELPSHLVIDLADSILRSSERVNRLVHDLLEQSRIESGLFGVRPRPVGIFTFLNEVADSYRPLAANNELTLKVILPEKEVEGCFDRDRIFQVLGNLLSNAFKFSPRGSSVTLEAKVIGQKVQFSVSDSGPGITEEDSPLVFSKFFQGKSHKFRGHGLGLWIAHEIVGAHQGQIGFNNAVQGTGATFWFTVPRASEKGVVLEGTVFDMTNRKVLLVDDDEDLTHTICKILRDKGIECHVVGDYESAVNQLSHDGWGSSDIVLVDYDLAGRNGGELVQWMHAKFAGLPIPKIVLISAHPDIDQRARTLKLEHFLRKPMNISEIFDLMGPDEQTKEK